MAATWSWQVYIRHQYIEHIQAVYPINHSSTLYQYALFCVSITVDSCDLYTYSLQDYLSGIGTFVLFFFYGHRSNIYGGYIQSIPTHKNTQKINANVLVCDLFRTSWRLNPSWGISPGLNHVYGNTNASLGKSRLFYSLPLNSYRLYSQNTLTLLWWSNNILNAIEVEWMRVHKSIETAISVES